MTKHATTLISIDPGYDRIGWAIGTLTGTKYILTACGCIQTDRKAEIFSRYLHFSDELSKIIQKYSPSAAAIESIFFSKNRTTAIKVSEARGVIIAALLQNGVTIHEYNPSEIKLAVTGYGNADKMAVEKMVRMQTNIKEGKILDDAIDAIAVGMTHAVTAHMRQAKDALNKASSS